MRVPTVLVLVTMYQFYDQCRHARLHCLGPSALQWGLTQRSRSLVQAEAGWEERSARRGCRIVARGSKGPGEVDRSRFASPSLPPSAPPGVPAELPPWPGA